MKVFGNTEGYTGFPNCPNIDLMHKIGRNDHTVEYLSDDEQFCSLLRSLQ